MTPGGSVSTVGHVGRQGSSEGPIRDQGKLGVKNDKMKVSRGTKLNSESKGQKRNQKDWTEITSETAEILVNREDLPAALK